MCECSARVIDGQGGVAGTLAAPGIQTFRAILAYRHTSMYAKDVLRKAGLAPYASGIRLLQALLLLSENESPHMRRPLDHGTWAGSIDYRVADRHFIYPLVYALRRQSL